MRPLWTGALTFGLVNIPVRLHSAVRAKEHISFRLLHKTDLSPIRYDRVCEKEGDVVGWKDIVKAYEYAKDKFVVLTRARRGFVIDGEVVAMRDGAPARVQELQSRMHVTNRSAIRSHRDESPVALIVFDMLVDGTKALVAEPWRVRRKHLAALLRPPGRSNALRLSDVANDGGAMLREAHRQSWEGIIAKRADAPYDAGKRSRTWLKLKIEQRQEFPVAGWTEPRRSRQYIGALLLGYYDGEGRLVYAGHTGTGFSQRSLLDTYRRLRRIERKTSPFATTPRTNERAHWARPSLAAEIKFNEWTADGKPRQPVFVGFRDDKDPREVVRESPSNSSTPSSVTADAARSTCRRAGSTSPTSTRSSSRRRATRRAT